MKASTSLITLIIVVCIIISIGLLLWLFVSGYFSQVKFIGENRTQAGLETLSSCMRIEEAFQNKFFIRNCGSGIITNSTLNVYVDDKLFDFNLTPSTIDGGDVGTLNLKVVWDVSIGRHTLRLTNPNTETAALFEAILPDSCILYFNFDEGSGTIAHDSSGHGNDGILHNEGEVCYNGYCPKWVDGKFGKALDFDGLGDFVEATDIPNTSLTIMAWVYPKRISGDERVIVSKFDWGKSYTQGWEWSFRLAYMGSGISQFQFYTVDEYALSYMSYRIPLNQWSHFAIAYDRENEDAEFYSNLEPIGSEWNGGQIRNTAEPVRVGAQGGGSFDYFNGTIDEVRIYNEVLTPDKILNFRII